MGSDYYLLVKAVCINIKIVDRKEIVYSKPTKRDPLVKLYIENIITHQDGQVLATLVTNIENTNKSQRNEKLVDHAAAGTLVANVVVYVHAPCSVNRTYSS